MIHTDCENCEQPLRANPDAEMVVCDRCGVANDTRARARAYRRVTDRLLATDDLGRLPALEPLVSGYLYRDTLAMLYGPSGSGKTFQAVAWALHIATGRWWEGHRVEQAPVLYVISEGARMMAQRVQAWTDHHGVDLGDAQPIHWHTGTINLSDRDHVAAVGQVAGDLGAGLVVIDTLARCAGGAEENSAKDMSMIVEHADMIVGGSGGACVLLVHHSGKDAAAGARGSSVLRAAMDTEIALDAAGRLQVTKAKDWAPPSPLDLALTPVGASCVLVGAGSSSAPKHADLVLDALHAAVVPGGVSTSVWLAACDAVPERSFYRSRAYLLDAGAVVNIGTASRPRYVPAEPAP